MKNIYLFLSIFILTISTSFADGHNIKKDGFLSKKFKVTKLSTIEDPTNKIILSVFSYFIYDLEAFNIQSRKKAWN